MKRKSKNILPVGVLLLLCGFLTACNGDVPTYEIKVSGTVVDTKGNPIAGADINISDVQKDQTSMFYFLGNSKTYRIVATTTTDENGHYELMATTEGRHFDVNAIHKEENWDNFIAQSRRVECKFASGMSEYVVDMVVITETAYYTGDAWKDAIEATPLEIGLSDSIQIRVKDGGSILLVGIWFDNPCRKPKYKEDTLYHSFFSDYGLFYNVNGGSNKLEAGLTEYNLVFQMDTTNMHSSTRPYCECCYLRVISVKENQDEDDYYIPLTIVNKSK